MKIAHPLQKALLNGDGNKLPGEAEDGAQAAIRGFGFSGTLDEFNWPPHIFSVSSPAEITNGRGIIQADVRDDALNGVDRVWAIIYKPGYTPPTAGDSLVQDISSEFALETIVLVDNGNNLFSVAYSGFREPGTYRVVVYLT